jgi:hypothetical protein
LEVPPFIAGLATLVHVKPASTVELNAVYSNLPPEQIEPALVSDINAGVGITVTEKVSSFPGHVPEVDCGTTFKVVVKDMVPVLFMEARLILPLPPVKPVMTAPLTRDQI